jgi:hypothetical protein
MSFTALIGIDIRPVRQEVAVVEDDVGHAMIGSVHDEASNAPDVPVRGTYLLASVYLNRYLGYVRDGELSRAAKRGRASAADQLGALPV